ncbi:helix-turn-helix domain-containing protein [Kribbella sp. NPDC055071]
MGFSDRLREYRGRRGWSLGELARATHYSRSHLSNVENGRKVVSDELAKACDDAL